MNTFKILFSFTPFSNADHLSHSLSASVCLSLLELVTEKTAFFAGCGNFIHFSKAFAKAFPAFALIRAHAILITRPFHHSYSFHSVGYFVAGKNAKSSFTLLLYNFSPLSGS